MRVFDIHVHIYPEKVALKASQSIGLFYEGIYMHGNGTLEDCLSMMDAAGVRYIQLRTGVKSITLDFIPEEEK